MEMNYDPSKDVQIICDEITSGEGWVLLPGIFSHDIIDAAKDAIIKKEFEKESDHQPRSAVLQQMVPLFVTPFEDIRGDEWEENDDIRSILAMDHEHPTLKYGTQKLAVNQWEM